MINLISAGDLDFYRVKRYVCDSKDDFVELPVVAEGSTVTIISTGETYKINAEGEWILDSSISGGEGGVGPQGPAGEKGEKGDQGIPGEKGEAGYSPVKGVDYWTDADKAEVVEDLLGMKALKPVYDPVKGNLYCNGVGVIIEDSGSDNLIIYDLDTNTRETMNVPYETRIFGGGDGTKKPCSYAGSSIVMNGGKVKSVRGGGLGGCNVGSASIVINGGKISSEIAAGGGNNQITDDATGNIVGYSSVVVNGGEALMLYGGCATGMGRLGSADIEINDGNIKWVTAGGSNGTAGSVKVAINGGKFTVVQSVNRGSIGSSVITVNGGLIERLYGGGETEDASVNGIVGKSVLNILGGQVNKLAKGTSNGVEGTDFISGKYVGGVIGNEEIAESLNLVRVPTLEETIIRLIEVERSVSITDIQA